MSRNRTSPSNRNTTRDNQFGNSTPTNEQPVKQSNVLNCISIDLGNTNTCIALCKISNNHDMLRDDALIEIVTNPQGNRQTPSTVSFNVDSDANNELLHGEQTGSTKPNNIYTHKKSLIDRTSKQLNELRIAIDKYIDYTVHDDNGVISIRHSHDNNETQLSITNLLQQYIGVMRNEVEQYIGSPIDRILVNVPNEYTESQSAAYIQLFKELRLVPVHTPYNDAVLACIAYDIDKNITSDNTVNLVIDISHIAARYTLIGNDKGLYRIITDVSINSLYTSGVDNVLIGHNVDQLLINYYITEINKKFKTTAVDAKNIHSKPYIKLRRALQNVKHILSTSQQTSIEIDSLYDGMDYNASMTRSKYESIISPLLNNLSTNINTVINNAQLTIDDIDNVILVGGTCKIPLVQSTIEKIFDNKPAQILKSIVTDECIALGGAKQLSYIAHLSAQQLTQTISNNTTLSLPIGIETANGIFYEILPIGTTLPASTAITTTTSQNNQSSVQITLYEGINTNVNENHKLATFVLSDIPAMEAGIPRISLQLSIDINGNIIATATEHSTSVTISVDQSSATTRYNKSDVEKHMKSNKHDINTQHNTTHLLQLSTLYSRLAGVLFDKDHDTAAQQINYTDDVKTLHTIQKYIQSVTSIDKIDTKQLQEHLDTLQTLYNKYFERSRTRSSRKSSYKPSRTSSNVNGNGTKLEAHDDID